jgi:hypothetical protein
MFFFFSPLRVLLFSLFLVSGGACGLLACDPKGLCVEKPLVPSFVCDPAGVCADVFFMFQNPVNSTDYLM